MFLFFGKVNETIKIINYRNETIKIINHKKVPIEMIHI